MKRGRPDEGGDPPKRPKPDHGKNRAKTPPRCPSPPVEEKEEPDENGAGSIRMAIERERDLGCLRERLLQAFTTVSVRMARLEAEKARNHLPPIYFYKIK